jgi:hypothetical protein
MYVLSIIACLIASLSIISHISHQVFVPKAQREKVDPKMLVAFLTQVCNKTCTPILAAADILFIFYLLHIHV